MSNREADDQKLRAKLDELQAKVDKPLPVPPGPMPPVSSSAMTRTTTALPMAAAIAGLWHLPTIPNRWRSHPGYAAEWPGAAQPAHPLPDGRGATQPELGASQGDNRPTTCHNPGTMGGRVRRSRSEHGRSQLLVGQAVSQSVRAGRLYGVMSAHAHSRGGAPHPR